jgi:hypothetical protein
MLQFILLPAWIVAIRAPMGRDFMVSAAENTALVCPRCGLPMRFFESFPARGGLPEVEVFECASCENMILQDRKISSTTPGDKLAS